MKNRKTKFTLAGFFLLFLASFLFERQIFSILPKIQNNFLDQIFLPITLVGTVLIGFFLIATLFLWREHKSRWIIPLWFSATLSAGVSYIIKIIIQRPRPYQQNLIEILPILIQKSQSVWDFSFPSFHAMVVFAAVPILAKEFKKTKIFWVIFAILVAISRVYFGLHFLSDVIFGGLIGYIIGLGIVKLEQKYKIGKRIMRKISN